MLLLLRKDTELGGENGACQFHICFYFPADMSPLCPPVTPVTVCHPRVRLSPLVRLSPPCPPVATVPGCHHWSNCHHCVRLSPLCSPVTPVSGCHLCVHSIGGPGAREAICPFMCTAAHSSGLCAGACEAQCRSTLCNGCLCFLV